MDPFDSLVELIEGKSKPKNKKEKRKWREIEQYKEKKELERELEFYDGSLEHLLEDY
ncbi:DUF3545 family protein [Thalassotalea aquiviva]|uniref:DUF3545 family protein n=1 Tax=Thalassotalea aquiviva TaxID=3242415 RepID=UPI003529DAAE